MMRMAYLWHSYIFPCTPQACTQIRPFPKSYSTLSFKWHQILLGEVEPFIFAGNLHCFDILSQILLNHKEEAEEVSTRRTDQSKIKPLFNQIS